MYSVTYRHSTTCWLSV